MNSPSEEHSPDMRPVYERLPEGYAPGGDLFPLQQDLGDGVSARLVSRNGSADLIEDGLKVCADAFADDPDMVPGMRGTYKQILDGQTTLRMIDKTSADFGQVIEWEGFFVYYQEDVPVGIGGLYRYVEEPTEHWVGLIGVTSDAKGTGIAGKMIQHTIDCAKERGGTVLKAYTGSGLENARAQRFYEKHGFKLNERSFVQKGEEELIFELPLIAELPLE